MVYVSKFKVLNRIIHIKDSKAASDIENILDEIDGLPEVKEKTDKIYGKRLKNKKVIMIGDSYSTGASGTQDKGWMYYFEEASECEAVSRCKMSSGGFINKASSGEYVGMNFSEALNAVASTQTTAERAKIDVVLCCGGINDVASNTTAKIGEAVTGFIATAKLKYPNAEIWVLPLYCDANFGAYYFNADGEQVTIYNGGKKYEAFNAITQNAITHGANSTLDSVFWLLGRTTFGHGDGIHPNDYGFIQQGRRINAILSGSDSTYNTEIVNETGYADSVSSNFRCVGRNGNITIRGKLEISNAESDKPILSLPQYMLPSLSNFYTALFSDGTNYAVGTIYYDPMNRCFKMLSVPESLSVTTVLSIHVNLSYTAGF